MEFVASCRAGWRGNRQRIDAMNGEPNRRRSFELKDATINGALLAGTKFYEKNGEQRRFEAVLVNHTVASGKNANAITSRDTTFGIGFIEAGNREPILGREAWEPRLPLNGGDRGGGGAGAPAGEAGALTRRRERWRRGSVDERPPSRLARSVTTSK